MLDNSNFFARIDIPLGLFINQRFPLPSIHFSFPQSLTSLLPYLRTHSLTGTLEQSISHVPPCAAGQWTSSRSARRRRNGCSSTDPIPWTVFLHPLPDELVFLLVPVAGTGRPFLPLMKIGVVFIALIFCGPFRAPSIHPAIGKDQLFQRCVRSLHV